MAEEAPWEWPVDVAWRPRRRGAGRFQAAPFGTQDRRSRVLAGTSWLEGATPYPQGGAAEPEDHSPPRQQDGVKNAFGNHRFNLI